MRRKIVLDELQIQGAIKKWEKSNHIFWCKNRVKFLFLAHYLRGNISPFTFIIFTTLWCHLFWSKFSIQKMLKNAQYYHIRPILANLPHWMAYYGLIWQPRIHWRPHCCHLIQQVIIWEVIEDFMGLISANHCNLLQKRIILSNFGHLAQFYSLDMPP